MEIGGKAHALKELQAAGFKVPPFFVCGIAWSKEQIYSQIDKTLPDVRYFAVRSSAQGEDSSRKSFAGHFYSAVGVRKEDIYKEIAKVAQSYKGAAGGVIVQEFIPSDLAGVMFTEVDKGNIVVNATIGLCQSVVNGEACDEYVCDKRGTILKKTIAQKPIRIFTDGKIDLNKSEEESLSTKQIEQLCKLAMQLQKLFDSPQDVEWCFKNGELYILQSRPVTRDFSAGKVEYFDSANIAESYSGIVLPLTCTFAKMVYAQVYQDLLGMSGVSKKKLERHSDVFGNLLGFFYGRMYYNMNNWYRMAEFVPGYKRNKQNFELMITSNVKEEVGTAITPSLTLKIFYPLIVVVKVAVYGLTAIYFKKSVERHLRWLRNHDFEKLNYNECVELFENLNKKLLRKWYITLENDFFVMTYLGLLKKMVGEDNLQHLLIFPSKATEQVAALASLSHEMSLEKTLWEAVEVENVSKFEVEITKHPIINKSLTEYLHVFGGRFANELKLESVGVDEDTKKLLAVLKIYRSYQPTQPSKTLELRLPFFRRLLVRIVLIKFKKYASRREEFRLLRSNTFAMARKLFKRMGKILSDEKAIENAEDVFYLHLAEILEPKSKSDLKNNILKRKQEYADFQNLTPPSHFSTVNNVPPPVKEHADLDIAVIHGRPASSGLIRGKVRVFKDFFMPSRIDFDILVTSHTDPGWTSLIALSKGLIIEHGGVLSHASIVARELGIPAVIGATDAVTVLKDNQYVELDGSSGMIKVLDYAS